MTTFAKAHPGILKILFHKRYSAIAVDALTFGGAGDFPTSGVGTKPHQTCMQGLPSGRCPQPQSCSARESRTLETHPYPHAGQSKAGSRPGERRLLRELESKSVR